MSFGQPGDAHGRCIPWLCPWKRPLMSSAACGSAVQALVFSDASSPGPPVLGEVVLRFRVGGETAPPPAAARFSREPFSKAAVLYRHRLERAPTSATMSIMCWSPLLLHISSRTTRARKAPG